jgi:hypothetical protein
MVLVIAVSKVPESVYVIVVVGSHPSDLKFNKLVFVKGFGDGVLKGGGMWGNGVLVVVIVSVIVVIRHVLVSSSRGGGFMPPCSSPSFF